MSDNERQDNKKQVDELRDEHAEQKAKHRQIAYRIKWASIAAAICLIAGFSAFALLRNDNKTTDQSVGTISSTDGESSSMTANEISSVTASLTASVNTSQAASPSAIQTSGLAASKATGKASNQTVSQASKAGIIECYPSVVYYKGCTYILMLAPLDIKVGKMLGVVKIDLKGYTGQKDKSVIGSTMMEPGDEIYEWPGYSEEYRVVGMHDGKTYAFERNNGEGLVGLQISKWFPDTNKVAEIRICDNQPVELGRITEQSEIKKVLDILLKDSQFIDTKWDDVCKSQDNILRLFLKLSDGSEAKIVLFENDVGHWMSFAKLTKGFRSLIESYIIYHAGYENLNYGAICASDNYELREIDAKTEMGYYTMASVWVKKGILYIGNKYDTNKQYALANDAAGDIRIEGTNIWYRTTSGSIAHLRFRFPKDESALYDALENKEDLSKHITTRETLYKGPFTALQVRLGIIWTLDEKGTLSKNNVPIAEGVNCFALDGDGVTYGGADGLYRRLSTDSSVKRMANMKVNAIAAAGVNVYYATADGEIRQIRVDGTDDMLIYTMQAVSLSYNNNYGSSNVLTIIGQDNKAYMLFNDSKLFCVAENAKKAESSSPSLCVLYENGDLILYEFSFDSSKSELYFREVGSQNSVIIAPM